LEEANKALNVKVAAVADLEEKITILEESLMSATSEVGSKNKFISDLETAKISAESQLADAQEALDKMHEQLTDVRFSLESVEKEVRSSLSSYFSRS
jgi:chromosome segregation ATPase